jgi:enoyl-CoA hydratase/carnithine racemase
MLGFPETGHGLVPGLGGALLAQRTVGLSRAIHLILSAEMVGADEALGLGLVDRIVERKQLEAEAVEHLRRLTQNRSPRVIHAAMEAIHAGRRLPREEALRRETAIFCELAARPERTPP